MTEIKERSEFAREFGAFNQNWSPNFEYNVLFLRAQQNYANEILRNRGHLFLNEVYDMLGFERVGRGQTVGWIRTEDNSPVVDFGMFGEDSPLPHLIEGKPIPLDFNVEENVHEKI